MDIQLEPYLSQASSHFTIEPVSGETLFDLEITRREGLRRNSKIGTGCKELDDYVLLGGFERGCVVGVSAEDVEVGLLVAFQTIAETLVSDAIAGPRVAVITTLAAPAILPTLRDVIKCQVQARSGSGTSDESAQVKQCLESISISRVFDIEGLWEVLTELERSSQPESKDESGDQGQQQEEAEPPESSQRSPSPAASPALALPPLRTERTEIADSEDEEDLTSSSPSASVSAGAPRAVPENETKPGAPVQGSKPTPEPASGYPEIILITHFSTLMTTLFAQRDKSSAHTSLQLLSSHLRYLSRSSGALVMLLNVTTSPFTNPTPTAPTSSIHPGEHQDNKKHDRPLDPTLRSIFNPPPPATNAYGSAGLALSRRNKPAFGLTFSQFLDLHLLCTRVPRTREDAEAAYAPALHARRDGRDVRYAWVVEVLLDELGTWEAGGTNARGGDELGRRRRDREQRWCALDVKDGMRIVEAFERKGQTANMQPIRLAAGFGGPRV